MTDFWDARFGEAEFAYGEQPNDWVAEVGERVPAGPVLELAAGQGRNGVWLAGLGHEVTLVDQSPVGLARARELAESRGLTVRTEVADLAEYELGEAGWAGIVSVFGHVPPELRRDLHRRVVRALRPGGVFVLEAYTPDQVGRGTGGPPDPALTMSLAGLREELAGLEFVRGEERVRQVVEGRYHTGEAAVVRVLARK